MKFAEEIFPKGTFKDQQTDGAYINEYLAKNLDTMAKKIADDMTFLGIICGHDMVGDGKSTMLTQVGSYLTWKINQLHGTNNTFTDKNMVMRGKDISQVSLELPKYSVIGLDEGDDLTTHGMKELAIKLKRYFRKCRQLNQIIIIILPSFFELPKFYALNRSHFLIDVYFEKEFSRGYFSFYSPSSKKMLYLKGKKEWNYEAWRPDFKGRFFSSYCFTDDIEGCTRRYKQKKFDDMQEEGEPEQTKEQAVLEKTIELVAKMWFYLRKKGITQKDLAKPTEVTQRTVEKYIYIAKKRGVIPLNE